MIKHDTRLFTISLWQVQQGDDPLIVEWRGKLKSLPEGDTFYFNGVGELIQHLERITSERED